MSSTKEKANKKSSLPPAIIREADWEEVTLPFGIASGRTLVSGLQGGDQRLRAAFFKRTRDNHLIGKVWCGPGTEGPPGHVHGGASAYLLDEAMGSAGWMAGFPVVAAGLEFEYLLMAPLFQDLTIDAWVQSIDKRRVEIRAELLLPDGRVAIRAKGNFHKLTRAKVAALFKNLTSDENEREKHWLEKDLDWADDDAN